MRQTLTTVGARLKGAFATWNTSQKITAAVGAAALLVAATMMVRWVVAPDYAPLFTNMAAADASAVILELDARGVTYELTNGGSTIMVPREQVYKTRIDLSGEGLPASDRGGYSLLDGQDLSTSQFKEQTDFKRAMEGELARTIESIEGVRTAVVHLAMPPKQVFADEQDPATASVLVDVQPGATFAADQVQAVTHLVASSIDGLKTDRVVVADASGRVLSASDGDGGVAAGSRAQQVDEFQRQMVLRIKAMLDRVVGPDNNTVQVTANLDFDKAVSETTKYRGIPEQPPLSETTNNETYDGPASGAAATGVVGPDGQMDNLGSARNGDLRYRKKSSTRDNAVDTTVEHRENAPGKVNSLHVAVVVDTGSAMAVDADEIQDLVQAAVGIDIERGDTVQVSAMPFDRSADEDAAAELAEARKAAERAELIALVRNLVIGLGVLLLLLILWRVTRARARARQQAATQIVEQLRQEAADRSQVVEDTSIALAALEESEAIDEEQALRAELAALVERQPEEVATLLRGWLVERP